MMRAIGAAASTVAGRKKMSKEDLKRFKKRQEETIKRVKRSRKVSHEDKEKGEAKILKERKGSTRKPLKGKARPKKGKWDSASWKKFIGRLKTRKG